MKPKILNGTWYIEVYTKEFGYTLLLDDSGLPIPRPFDSEDDAFEFIKDLKILEDKEYLNKD